MAANREYRVVPADPLRDRDVLLDLWKRYLPPPGLPFPERRYVWEFQENPSGQARSWLLIAGSGDQAVGTASLVPRLMWMGNTTRLVGRASALVVAPEHRTLGPAIMLERAVLRAMDEWGLATIFSVAPPPALGLVLRVGYAQKGDYARHAKAIDLAPQVQRLTGSAMAARVLAGPLNLAWRVVSSETWTSRRNLEFREVDGFDAKFDELWDRASRHYGTTTARTASFLRWRFDACPCVERFVTLGLFSAGHDRLLGYVVCFLRDGHVQVYDLFCDHEGREFEGLASGLFRWARQQRARTVSVLCAGPPAFVHALRRSGVRRRHDENQPAALVVAQRSGRGDLGESGGGAGWYILPADNF